VGVGSRTNLELVLARPVTVATAQGELTVS
jgi:hypothetical protein